MNRKDLRCFQAVGAEPRLCGLFPPLILPGTKVLPAINPFRESLPPRILSHLATCSDGKIRTKGVNGHEA